MDDDEKYNIKIIIIGDSGVGKTNLINVYNNGQFIKESNSTLTSNYISKTQKIGQIEYDVQLWDTPGQEKYRSITKLFYRGTKICIIVYDITNRTTFESLDYWVGSVNDVLGKDPLIAIVGNKIDLFEEEKINEKEGMEYATKIGASFYLASAKEDPRGFSRFMESLIKKYVEEHNLDGDKNKKLNLKSKSSKKKLKKGDCLCPNNE
jgi:small GTP-binding protein